MSSPSIHRTFRLATMLVAVLVSGVSGPMPASAETLEIVPRGTYFEIAGPMGIRGRDVVDVDVLPDGAYRVRAQGIGLAAARARFEVDREGLRPVSWSGPTSLLMPPGIDHLTHGESRGWFHLFSGAIGAAFLYTTVDDLGNTVEGTEAEADKRNVRNLWTAYLTTTWVSASLESWLLTPQGSTRRTSDGHTIAVPRADRWNPTFRSVLVPGAGQRYLGHDARANMFTTLFAISAAAAIKTQDLYLEARRATSETSAALNGSNGAERDALRAAFDDAAADEDTKSLIRWIAVGTTAYVYLWNVFDAFASGRHAERSSGPQVVAVPTNDGVALSLSWNFR